MSLKTRLTKVEKAWYTLEAEHYGAHWSDLYEKDSVADAQGEAFDKLADSAEPPYWFWPKSDEWQRKWGWAMSHTDEANALFNEMFDRLKKFVDAKLSKTAFDALRLRRNAPRKSCIARFKLA